MKVQYFKHTDTLYIEFCRGEIVGTRDLDGDSVNDGDAEGWNTPGSALASPVSLSRKWPPNFHFMNPPG